MATISATRGFIASTAVCAVPRAHEEERRTPSRRRGSGSDRGTLGRPERAILIVLAGVLVLCALASRYPTANASVTTRVRVEQGDTLWAIAARNTPAGLSVAQTADLIAQLNGLDSSSISVGSELDVPTTPRSNSESVASR